MYTYMYIRMHVHHYNTYIASTLHCKYLQAFTENIHTYIHACVHVLHELLYMYVNTSDLKSLLKRTQISGFDPTCPIVNLTPNTVVTVKVRKTQLRTDIYIHMHYSQYTYQYNLRH